MPKSAADDARLRLPARIRLRPASKQYAQCLRTLGEQLSELDGVSFWFDGDAVGWGTIDSRDDSGATAGDEKLCFLNQKSVAVFGLDEWDRYEVLRRGWGSLRPGHVLLHFPRDDYEIDLILRIVKQAMAALTTGMVVDRIRRSASPWELPRFSRTPLQ